MDKFMQIGHKGFEAYGSGAEATHKVAEESAEQTQQEFDEIEDTLARGEGELPED